MSRTAERRHNDERVLQRRMELPRNRWGRGDQRWQGIKRWTGTTCSCLGCRVNRRHYGPSVQERRQVAWLEVA